MTAAAKTRRRMGVPLLYHSDPLRLAMVDDGVGAAVVSELIIVLVLVEGGARASAASKNFSKVFPTGGGLMAKTIPIGQCPVWAQWIQKGSVF